MRISPTRCFTTLLPLVLFACSGEDGLDPNEPDAQSTTDASASTKDASVDVTAAQDGAADTSTACKCGVNETCAKSGACICKENFVPSVAGGCEAAAANSPASHTKSEVCAKWKEGHVVTTKSPYTKGAKQCDVGTLARGGITDTLLRINMFRWMEGLAPVTDDATKNAGDQSCAILQAWNDPSSLTPSPHKPQSTATCYSSLGATWSGQSNLAWGVSTSDAIDLYIEDPGSSNAASFGHRRWVLNPPLGKVGIGFVSGGSNGNSGGQAQCLGVFDTTGTGPSPSWFSWPPAGYVPVEATNGVLNEGWGFTFHMKQKNVVSNAKITMRNLTKDADAAVTVKTLNQGYGYEAISFYPSGWKPEANSIYRATVDVPSVGKIIYDVLPVSCP